MEMDRHILMDAEILLNGDNKMNLKVVLDDGAFMPEKAHNADAGFDIKTPIKVIIPAKSSRIIPTGVHIEIPYGYVGFLKSKSGLNLWDGILSEGVIDSGYTGAIVVKLYNHSNKEKIFKTGDKITQLVVLPLPEVNLIQVDGLKNTERGNNGFGSTGR